MLRSPLHVFMSGLLLMTVTGRKSGRAISTPVNYVRDGAHGGDTLLIISKANRTWWKNLRGGAPVTLLMSGKTYRAAAAVSEDRIAVEEKLLRFFHLTKRTLGGIHLDKNGQPTQPEKFAQVAQLWVVIEITQLVKQ
jgi:hypothetical protein